MTCRCNLLHLSFAGVGGINLLQEYNSICTGNTPVSLSNLHA